MVDSVLLPSGEQYFYGLDGKPLAGGLVYMYVPFTTTPKTTWVDQGETTPNTNPIVLDALGRAIIWGNGVYRQLVTDAAGNLILDQLTSDGGISDLQGQINTVNTQITTINGQIASLQTAVTGQKKWLYTTKSPTSTTYQASQSDSGTLFTSQSSGGTLTITLPNTTTIQTGWYCALLRLTNDIVAQVFGAAGEHIVLPTSQSLLSVKPASANEENLILSFDGNNYEVIEATPSTFQSLGASNFYSPSNPPPLVMHGQAFTSNGTFTIPATTVKITMVGGGGGGGGGGTTVAGAGGGSAAGMITWLGGLTVGNTLAVTVGVAGTAGSSSGPTGGSDGGDTLVSSSSQTISTITAGRGHGGSAGLNSPGQANGGAGGAASGGNVPINGNPGENTTLTEGGQQGILGLVGTYGIGGAGAGLNGAGNAGGVGIVIFEWVA